MFKENDYVFYGTVGVSKIERISELEFGEKGKLYYVIQPVDKRHGTIYTLVDNDKVFMREIISADRAKELIEGIGKVKEINCSDRKLQASEYRELEKAGDYEKWMGMLKNAYKKRQKKLEEGKKPLSTEEQIFKAAEGLLMEEFAVAMDMSVDDIIDMIQNKVKEVE